MKKAFEQIKKHWITNLVTFVISLIVGVVIFLVFYFARNQTIVAAVDGAAIGTVAVLFMGLLFWMAHLGAFDTFAFGFKQLGSMLFAKDARRDGKYSDYRAEKSEKRQNSSYNFVAVIAAGLVLSVALIVLEIIYHAAF